jgi:peptide/nickel transport system substrate-binding protein
VNKRKEVRCVKKQIFCLLLALATTLTLLTGCSDDPATRGDDLGNLTNIFQTEKKDPALTSFSLAYQKTLSLDPITCSDGVPQTVGALLYEGLFELDPSFAPQPVLCDSYTYDPVTFTYTLNLRSGVQFSDGAALSASDVAATLKRAAASVRYAARLADMDSVSASGDQVVTLRLKSDNAMFAARLDIPIVKAGTETELVPVGTGPYRLDSDASALVPNTSWWRGGRLPINKIGLYSCSDEEAVAYAFHTHDIQLLTSDLTGTNSVGLSGNGNFTDAATTVLEYVGFNLSSSLFADVNLRSALNCGVDRAGAVNAYLLSHGTAAQFPLSPASAYYPKDLETAYSTGTFESAMNAAGYCSGNARSATLLVNSENSFKVAIAQKIATDLSSHDLKISVESVDWETYQNRLKSGSFDLYLGEIRLTADWDLTPLLSTAGVLNYGHYSDENMNLLLLNLKAAKDETARAQAFSAFCTYFAQQSPLLPICFKTTSVLLQSGAVTQAITPTAANPFYGLSDWQLHLK